jgi:hypothetical protein
MAKPIGTILKRLPAGQPRKNTFLYSLGRPKQIWEEGIRIDLREIGWRGGGVEWMQLAQDRGHGWLM